MAARKPIVEPDPPKTFAELMSRMSPANQAFILADAAAAPPFPPDVERTLTQIFSGAGERIAAQRAARDQAA